MQPPQDFVLLEFCNSVISRHKIFQIKHMVQWEEQCTLTMMLSCKGTHHNRRDNNRSYASIVYILTTISSIRFAGTYQDQRKCGSHRNSISTYEGLDLSLNWSFIWQKCPKFNRSLLYQIISNQVLTFITSSKIFVITVTNVVKTKEDASLFAAS